MANAIGAYNEMWYANKSIERLEKLLTFAPTIDRQFDETGRTKGEKVQLKRAGEFTAENFPTTNVQDLNPTEKFITLDQWKGVQFAIDDKELYYTGDEIIKHHIDPAMQAVADAIEQSLWSLYKDVPWYVDVDGSTPTNDFVNCRTRLNKNNVPSQSRRLALNFDREAVYLQQNLFVQANTGSEGGETQRNGLLGRKMGFDTYANANAPNHTSGTASATALALVGAAAKGATTVTLDAGSVTGTVVPGDSFVLAGNPQRYAITNTVTAAGNTFTGVTFTPPLVQAHADNDAATLRTEDKGISMAYDMNAFTMLMAPLSDDGTMSALIGSAVDDQTGLAIRWMRWYDPLNKKHFMSFDALWGKLTVDPNRAVRLEGATV